MMSTSAYYFWDWNFCMIIKMNSFHTIIWTGHVSSSTKLCVNLSSSATHFRGILGNCGTGRSFCTNLQMHMIKKRKKYNRIVLRMWIGNNTENYYLLQLCTTITMHRFLKSQKIALTYFMSRTWFIPSIWTTTLPASIFRPFKNYCKIVNQSVKRVFKTVHNWVVLPRYT